MKRMGHLSEDELITALVDRSDLSGEGDDHLNHCRECRERLENLAGSLAMVGRSARSATPQRRRPVPIRRSRSASELIRTWRPAAAGLVAAAIMICGLWLWPVDSNRPLLRSTPIRDRSVAAATVQTAALSGFHDFLIGSADGTSEPAFDNFLLAQAGETDRDWPIAQ